jgi:S-adenosylmethionine:tRNA ribosyltransferase-isomerase
MLIDEFDYELPDELIAQTPLERRDASRMLIVDRKSGTWFDSHFHNFPDHIQQDDLVVVNNSRVIPARLSGRRQGSGGKVELFLVRELEPQVWETLLRPGARLKKGACIELDQDTNAEVLDDPGGEIRKVRFHSDGPFDVVLNQIGSTPLPPYIKRSQGTADADRERYQTIYSRERGAIAAPTAGLHFTPEILSRVKSIANIAEVTLHVGYGTFEPVRVSDISEHSVSAERFEISDESATAINSSQGRVIVVGTTTMRALESAASDHGKVESGQSEAHLTIKPGYEFRVAGALLTNFHLPKSSLLLLVSAFAGKELIFGAYRHAVAKRYRFYSYGDCMLIL